MHSHFDVGKALQTAQIKKGIGSTELANRLGITKQQVSQWRYRSDAKLSLVVKICEAIDIPPLEFLALAENI